MKKPYSPSCERNKVPILNILKSIITSENRIILEIGSGTGQHAAFMAPYFPHLQWIPSDLGENIEGIKNWIAEARTSNISHPIELDISEEFNIPKGVDTVFSANVIHIASWEACLNLFRRLSETGESIKDLIFYGPFNYDNSYTSKSNEQFDYWLKERNPESGIRNFEDICFELNKSQFALKNDFEMPANNRVLHFTR